MTRVKVKDGELTRSDLFRLMSYILCRYIIGSLVTVPVRLGCLGMMRFLDAMKIVARHMCLNLKKLICPLPQSDMFLMRKVSTSLTNQLLYYYQVFQVFSLFLETPRVHTYQ